MKVSVIIPVYNTQRYLQQTLYSIINQTYNNIEIICVNDGSTDNSLIILQQFHDKIRIIDQENKGQCAASNAGLKAATGDYIKFFDADDLMNPEHIELQIKKLNGSQDAIASCEWGRFYNDDPLSAVFNPEPVWQDMKPLNWLKTAMSQKSDMMGAPLWLIPRKIIEKARGWDERLSLNNDFEFSTRLLLAADEVLFTSGAKIYYRSGLESNLASQKSKKAYEAALLSTQLGCQHLLNADNSDSMKQLCANRYQQWLYRIYPNYPVIIKQLENHILELGGSSIEMEGGKIFQIFKCLLGWKLAKRIQLLTYQLGYKPKHPHKK
ncbi:MAG: glycosyltransferase family 2 protein [Bacteroidales bacterium]|nr:glycosyltransferase family 2 protein [Bacteroidales bacterium]